MLCQHATVLATVLLGQAVELPGQHTPSLLQSEVLNDVKAEILAYAL